MGRPAPPPSASSSPLSPTCWPLWQSATWKYYEREQTKYNQNLPLPKILSIAASPRLSAQASGGPFQWMKASLPMSLMSMVALRFSECISMSSRHEFSPNPWDRDKGSSLCHCRGRVPCRTGGGSSSGWPALAEWRCLPRGNFWSWHPHLCPFFE